MNKARLFDYFILILRATLAFTLLSYGYGKLTQSQFTVKNEVLDLIVRDIDLFRLSWYFFGHEPFNYFIGTSQLIAGALLIYNRTAILGALMAFPIFLNILIIDITYVQMPAFYYRLSFYLFFDLLICWHYRDRLIAAFRHIFDGVSTKFKYPVWAFLLLPVGVVLVELLSALPRVIVNFFID